jgi:hypothetical protein
MSQKRRERYQEAREFREALIASVGHCEHCGGTPGRHRASRDHLCVHEIANGPLRQKALDKPYAVLVLCWPCNQLATDKGRWSEAGQLHCLLAARPDDFDLVAYNALVNPRAPNRITIEEVRESDWRYV